MAPSPSSSSSAEAGEDWIVTCANCGYRANLEKATSALDPIDDGESGELERFPTPGLRTIKALAEAHPDVAAPERQIKTLVYVVDGQPTILLLRGDHDLHEQKLIDTTGSANVRPAHPEEIRELLGADPGSLGGVGVDHAPIIADHALEGRHNMTTGANEDDWHYKGVDVARTSPSARGRLRTVTKGDRCVECGSELDLWKASRSATLQARHQVPEAFGAYVQDEAGNSHPVVMGSYGIGVERNMAAVVEANHDDAGIIWPVSVAPYEVVITMVRQDDEAVREAGSGSIRSSRRPVST